MNKHAHTSNNALIQLALATNQIDKQFKLIKPLYHQWTLYVGCVAIASTVIV